MSFFWQAFLIAFNDILNGVTSSLNIEPSTIPSYAFCPTTAGSYLESVVSPVRILESLTKFHKIDTMATRNIMGDLQH